MTDLVFELFNAEELLLDTCAGTLAIAEPCLQLSGHHRLVEYEKHTVCFQDVLYTTDRSIREASF